MVAVAVVAVVVGVADVVVLVVVVVAVAVVAVAVVVVVVVVDISALICINVSSRGDTIDGGSSKLIRRSACFNSLCGNRISVKA